MASPLEIFCIGHHPNRGWVRCPLLTFPKYLVLTTSQHFTTTPLELDLLNGRTLYHPQIVYTLREGTVSSTRMRHAASHYLLNIVFNGIADSEVGDRAEELLLMFETTYQGLT